VQGEGGTPLLSPYVASPWPELAADVLLQLVILTLASSHEAQGELEKAASETYEAMTTLAPKVAAILQLAYRQTIGQSY
jgi:hypothetical protein